MLYQDEHAIEREIYFQAALFTCNIDFYNQFFSNSRLKSLLFFGKFFIWHLFVTIIHFTYIVIVKIL